MELSGQFTGTYRYVKFSRHPRGNAPILHLHDRKNRLSIAFLVFEKTEWPTLCPETVIFNPFSCTNSARKPNFGILRIVREISRKITQDGPFSSKIFFPISQTYLRSDNTVNIPCVEQISAHFLDVMQMFIIMSP